MPLVERLAIILESVGTSTVVKDFSKVSGAAGGLGDTSKKTAGLLRGLGVEGSQMSGMLAGGVTAAASAAGAALVSFGVKSVNTFVDLGQEVLKFQRASGATAEQASALIAAFDDVGVSAETGSKGIFQLGKRLGESGEGLKSFGIVAARGSDGNIDLAQTLKVVADAYVNTQDPARRAQLVAAAFGKAGQDLIPILERGKEGIDAMFQSAKDSNQILTPEQVQNAENFRLAMDGLNDSVRQFSIAAGSMLVPKLTEAAVAITGLIDKSKVLADSPLTPWLKRAFDASNPLLSAFHLVGIALDHVDTSALGAAGGLGEFGDSAGTAKSGAELLSDDLDDLQKSLLGVGNAERAQAQASQAVTAASQRVTDARQKLNDVLKEGAVDEKKVETATRDLAAATRSHERAVRDVADAQEKVNALNKELDDLLSGKTGAEKTAEAQDDLTAAQLRQRGAVSRQQRAQTHYNEVLADSTSTAQDAADAQLELEQASFDLKQSNDDLTDAQVALDAAQKVGAENSPEVIASREGIADATDDLDDKTGALATSTDTLTAKTDALKAAQAGDPVQYSKDLADARRGLKDAEDGLAGARGTLAQRTWDLIGAQDTLNTKLASGDGTAGLLKDKLQAMLDKHPQLAAFLDPLLADLDAANTKFGGVVDTLGKLGPALQIAGGLKPGVDPLLGFLAGYIASQPKAPGNLSPLLHAEGGVATRPTLGIFGEAGPEALVPLDRFGQFTSGGGGATYYINVSALDPEAASSAVIGAIREWERRNGTSWRN